MTPERFNIVKKETYVTKQGEEKSKWHRVGTKTVFTNTDGSKSELIEIPAIGLVASVFPADERSDKQASAPQTKAQEPEDTIEYPEDDINLDEIPFK